MSTENPIQRYEIYGDNAAEVETKEGKYVLFSDHQNALAEEYGRGVTAGKKEALHYSPSEREYYGKHVAQNDCWKDLKSQLAEVAAERDCARARNEANFKSWAEMLECNRILADERDRLNAELTELRCRGAVVL